jgi:glycosyltransferase involved in cell wall biosynthesis
LPIALIEALSFNKPIVCTRVGSLPEIFNFSDCIYIEQNSAEIAKTLTFVSNHLELLSELSNRSNLLFKNLFSNQTFVEKYASLFINISN